MTFQVVLDTRQFDPSAAVILAQADPALSTTNQKNRFAAATDYVHMSWSMVVEINRNSQTSKPQNRRHLEL
jgi:hypothetical protein